MVRKFLAISLAVLLCALPTYEVMAEGRIDGARATISSSHASYAIQTDGSLLSWGDNSRGQLGDNSTTPRYEPTRVVDMEDVVTVSASPTFALGVKSDATLWAWGDHVLAPLSGEDNSAERRRPVVVMDHVHDVSVGVTHMMAIGIDGSLWTAGANDRGQLGDGSTADSNRFIHIMDGIVAASAGHFHSMAVGADGTLWAWGDNSDGLLGDGTTEDRHTPIQIMENIRALSTNGSHTMVITADGNLWGWGDNRSGQVGDGTEVSSRTPVHIMDDVVAVSVGGAGGWRGGRTMAIRSDGSLWGWGNNDNGWLGAGLIRNQLEPVHIRDNVAAVVSSDFDTTLVLDTGGNLYVWGNNRWGQVGNGTTESQDLPMEILSNVRLPVPAAPMILLTDPGVDIDPEIGYVEPQPGTEPVDPYPPSAEDSEGSDEFVMSTLLQVAVIIIIILFVVLAVILTLYFITKSKINNAAPKTYDSPVPAQPHMSMAPAQAQPHMAPAQQHMPMTPAAYQQGSGRNQQETEFIRVARGPDGHQGADRRPPDRMPPQYPEPASPNGVFDPSVVADSYHIEKEVGGGAMSRTFVVRSKKLGSLWFLKFVSNKYGRLVNEEGIMKLLNHVCLPRIIDVYHRKEGVYLIQTLIEGIPLDKFRVINMKLSEAVLTHWFGQIAQTLNYLHNMRPTPVYHLDLKPSNIIITHDNTPILVDFGISRHFGEETPDAIMITADFAAPEQFGGLVPVKHVQAIAERFGLLPPEASSWRVDARSDIYSLGVIMFELATGQMPTQRNMGLLNNYISPELSNIIIKCISVHPAARYGHASELLDSLRKVKIAM